MRRVRTRIEAALGLAAAAVLVAACSSASGGDATLPDVTVPAPSAATGTAAHSHPAQAAPPAAPLRAGEWFDRLRMPSPYVPSPPNGGTDDYRCFLLNPDLRTAAYLTGSEFLPQNSAIVHHAIFFRVSPSDVTQARNLDAQSPGEGWTCFGGTGIEAADGPAASLDGDGPAWLAAWAPGGGEAVAPAGTGYALQPGSGIVMQVHYNLLAFGGKAPGPDRSGIQLRLRDGTAKLAPLQTTLLPAPVELPCPAGQRGPLCDRQTAVLDVMRRFGPESGAIVAGLGLLCDGGRPAPGPVQHCDRRIHQAGTVYAVAGHMHLLGRSITVVLNPDTPGAQTLLDVKVYNFHDQRARALPHPVAVHPGDTYRVTCTHDATLRQQNPQLRSLPPRYVVWGDGTSDEMCLGIVVWTRAS
jgi:Copper type II ascorbate-dependent monooxygenase, C-terminal domain